MGVHSIADWMASKDIAARDRAFEAMMSMAQLDIAALALMSPGRGATRIVKTMKSLG